MKQLVFGSDTLDIKGVVALEDGGTSATTAPRAAENLGMLLAADALVPFGPVAIDETTGRIHRRYFEGVADYRVEVDGPKEVRPGTENEYFITNFDSRIAYSVSAPTGTVRIEEDKIFYTAPTDIALSAGFVVNGEFWSLTFA